MRLTIFCNHYQAPAEHKECEAGIAFDWLRTEFGKYANWPCFRKRGEAPPPECSCDKAEFPTAEQLAAEDAEDAQRRKNIGAARKAIVAHLGGPWKRGAKSSAGQIDCPVCRGAGTLHFSRAGYNGHIHARCATPDCVAWME